MLPAFDTAVVVALCALQAVAVRLLVKSGVTVFLKPGGDLSVQIRVIGLEVEDIVRSAVDDGLRDGLLTSHGINGDDAAGG